MKSTIHAKLQTIAYRYNELKELLSDPDVTNDLGRYRDLSKECAQLEPLVETFFRYQTYQKQLNDTESLLVEKDPVLQQMVKQEMNDIQGHLAKLEENVGCFATQRSPRQ